MSALLLLLCIVVVSALVHEGGHALAALAVGWRIDGIAWRWYGVGIKVEIGPEPRDLWKVAAGGLAATALLAALCWILVPFSEWFWIAFVLNAVLLVCNLIPVPASDGRHLLRAIPASGKDKP